MCSGAIVNGRVDRVVYGCPDVKAGGAESIFNIITNPNLNHCAEVVSGICEEECAQGDARLFPPSPSGKQGEAQE